MLALRSTLVLCQGLLRHSYNSLDHDAVRTLKLEELSVVGQELELTELSSLLLPVVRAWFHLSLYMITDSLLMFIAFSYVVHVLLLLIYTFLDHDLIQYLLLLVFRRLCKTDYE